MNINNLYRKLNDKIVDSSLYRYFEYLRWVKKDQERLDFYSEFVSKGMLVFDVGANYGNRVKIFLRLGAKVVAFEPQRKCAKFLGRVYGENENFQLEHCAVGANSGKGLINISNASPLSSLSEEWILRTQQSGRFSHYKWDQQEQVEIAILESMIETYGTPGFVKIDVEGYELEVLMGLKSPVRAISFEYTPEMTDNALECIDVISQLGKYQFQISFGESMKFALERWLSSDEMSDFLVNNKRCDFGDVYAINILI